jgi:hypothetical protein
MEALCKRRNINIHHGKYIQNREIKKIKEKSRNESWQM